MIFIFYVMYPFLIKKSETPGRLIWNAALILVPLSLLRAYFGIIEVRTFLYFPIFIAGILTSWIGIPKKLKNSTPIFLVLLILIRLKWITMDAKDPMTGNFFPVVLSLSLFCMFFCFLIFEWVKSIKFSSNIAKLISKMALASYPVYLFHSLVLYSLKGVFSQYFNHKVFDLFTIFIILPIFVIICYYIQIYEIKISSFTKLWINYKRGKTPS
jgi:peptidoglycan/LPS O-acetylase OafA/YrhL